MASKCQKFEKYNKQINKLYIQILWNPTWYCFKKESNLTKEDWKERYEILKKYQDFLKVQRERK